MIKKTLPVGIDNFEKLIHGDYYYVDKTGLIKELLDKKGEVNLFTRPRRFGKTLNISMLQYFFEDTDVEELNQKHRELFDGLEIMGSGDTYLRHMCGYPVINLSLKSAKRAQYSSALYLLCGELAREFDRHRHIMEDLPAEKREKYQRILSGTASTDEYSDALRFLSEALCSAYKKKAVILIDEYDVPLENAWFNGFYYEMMDFLRSMFENALKTNPCLEFAVMTGCLRISRESIFTGLNNLEINSILSPSYSEYFGFTQAETDRLLADLGLNSQREILKIWYDGYSFGDSEVYNPWSVTNYLKGMMVNPDELPAPFWANTSSNNIIKNLVEKADLSVKAELESLLAGGVIEKPVHEDITYDSIYDSEDNLWNFLYFTGYLKKTSMRLEGDMRYVKLAIPNREVRYIYSNTIMFWFRAKVQMRDLSKLFDALAEGDADTVQLELSSLLMESISYMDGREEFYHGFLLGILENMKDYLVKSNRESGLGRYDIAVRQLDVNKTPMILELKVSDTFKGMEAACDRALLQIETNHYNDWLPEEGYSEVLDYGIAFYKKQCRVKVVHICFS